MEAEAVEGSEKLIKLKIDLGEDPPAGGSRQILAGIKQWYKPEDLVGKQVVVVANLEPRMMMGLESQGMILAADCDDPSIDSGQGKPIFLTVPENVSPGSKIR